MIRKPTDELLKQLMQSENAQQYIKENGKYLIDQTLPQQLCRLINEKKLSKSRVIKNAEMNEIYGYQIFSGKRTPSRDKLLCLCVGMRLDLSQTQDVLKSAGFAPLYPKAKRDSIILFGIEKGQSVCEINTALFDSAEDTL